MKKQFFGLIFVILFSILPSAVLAGGGNSIEFDEELDSDFSGGILITGNYILTDDIDLTDESNITIYEGDTVNLCLNGHVLKGNGDGEVITNKGTLNIYDYNTTTVHKFGDNDDLWVWDDELSGDDIKHTITGGVITGGTGKEDSDNNKKYGGGICNFATLNINGGNIVGNLADYGGGIYNEDDGVITIVGGTIIGNKATENGGGIFVNDTNVDFEEQECLVEGTLIKMADGSTKNIEDVVVGDYVKSFNHETGELENKKVYIVYEDGNEDNYFTLNFTNDIKLDICDCHDLFEQTAKQYVTITKENYNDYIGKYFYNATNGTWEELLSVTKSNDKKKYYSIYVSQTMNCIANDMLTIPDDVEYYFKMYEFNSDLTVNQDVLQADIEEYGIYQFEDCKLIDTIEEYEMLNIKYYKILLGKGLLTLRETDREIREYNYWINNSNQMPLMVMGFLGSYLTPAITVGGTTKIIDNAGGNVWLEDDKIIAISDDEVPSSTMSIGVALAGTTGTFVSDYSNNTYASYFFSDNEDYGVKALATDDEPTPLYNYNIEPVYEVTYNSNNATSGTVPEDTNKYFEDDDVTIAGNTGNLAKTDYKFLGWSTSQDGEVITTDTIAMVEDGLTLYAIWQEKETVSIKETAQHHTYKVNGQKFVISGNVKSDFVIKYFVNNDWTETFPINVGSYDVKITRLEDDTYKEYEKEIENGLIIDKANAVINVDQTTIVKTYGETIVIPKATSNFGTVVCDKTATDLENIGKYIITYTVASTNNYNGDIKKVVVTINKPKSSLSSKISSTKVIDKEGYEYCKKDESCVLNGFADVNKNAWYHDGIHYCYENGIVNGFEDGLFRPEDKTTRAQVITMLYNLEGNPSVNGEMNYIDTKVKAYYEKAVIWGTQNEIIKGYGNGNFGPDDNITREQMAMILNNYCNYKNYSISKKEIEVEKFEDISEVSKYARQAIEWAIKVGLIDGMSDTTISPKSYSTRAQVSTIIQRLCNI